MAETQHSHDFNHGVELFRIVRVHDDYKGTAGDKALLYRKCKCGKGKAFEYGSHADMLALLEQIKESQLKGQSNVLPRKSTRTAN